MILMMITNFVIVVLKRRRKKANVYFNGSQEELFRFFRQFKCAFHSFSIDPKQFKASQRSSSWKWKWRSSTSSSSSRSSHWHKKRKRMRERMKTPSGLVTRVFLFLCLFRLVVTLFSPLEVKLMNWPSIGLHLERKGKVVFWFHWTFSGPSTSSRPILLTSKIWLDT